MSELSDFATAMLTTHKSSLGDWPNLRYIVFAFTRSGMIRGERDQPLAASMLVLLHLIDSLLSEEDLAPEKKAALAVLESASEPFLDEIRYVERKNGLKPVSIAQ